MLAIWPSPSGDMFTVHKKQPICSTARQHRSRHQHLVVSQRVVPQIPNPHSAASLPPRPARRVGDLIPRRRRSAAATDDGSGRRQLTTAVGGVPLLSRLLKRPHPRAARPAATRPHPVRLRPQRLLLLCSSSSQHQLIRFLLLLGTVTDLGLLLINWMQINCCYSLLLLIPTS